MIGLLAIGFLVYNFWDQQYELIQVLRRQDPVDEVAIAEARNDILRTTLTATAGLAAAAVLLLNFQKQRHEEYNSTQQRIADLRIQAVQQLGSASPSVRIGGLHNLERLGEAHPELRQIVLDEICSYLRLDYLPGTEDKAPSRGKGKTDSGKGRSAESEVRLIAQEILQRHLKFKTGKQRREYWSHDRLNLKNAKLQNIDFSDCRLIELDFGGAEFTGYAGFVGAKFGGNADFGGAKFGGNADFGGAKFGGNADFGGAEFGARAVFRDAKFTRNADFRGAKFGGNADFRDAKFGGNANFGGAKFARDAVFGGAEFTGYAVFEGAEFGEYAVFGGAKFGGNAEFRGAKFTGYAVFEGAEFGGYAVFGGAKFGEYAVFGGVEFTGYAVFVGAEFTGNADFEGAKFTGNADFGSTVFSKLQDAQSLPVGWRYSDDAAADGTWRLVRVSPPDEPDASDPSSA
ncbi:pentapeptide repeat-containing protein [Glycomyces sp. NRRL B-16210]|uniref:pentapeptide repeat-containing protein n=1 Tax=Glycomyces sp. NRRL B-16210 TaxID=1463821 RepID=UPI0004C0E4A8|nr:pentapeptide repeat-containing protein [Glycomyces sp. NRRL B-16210]